MNSDVPFSVHKPPLRIFTSISSTNDKARCWVMNGAPDRATVIADTQTAGRGRLGRTWHSPKGLNLYLSQVIRGDLQRLRLIPLLGALAAREAIEKHLPSVLPVGIGWPNDILVLGHKICGILIELISEPIPCSIVGIGVNLNMTTRDFPAELRKPAASLRMLSGRRVNRAAFMQSLLDSMDTWCLLWRTDPKKLQTEFQNHCVTLGKRIQISTSDGKIFTALAQSLEMDGTLIVETDGGQLRRIEAADVNSAFC